MKRTISKSAAKRISKYYADGTDASGVTPDIQNKLLSLLGQGVGGIQNGLLSMASGMFSNSIAGLADEIGSTQKGEGVHRIMPQFRPFNPNTNRVMANGGVVETEDPYDKRLQAYNDSLSLYKLSQYHINNEDFINDWKKRQDYKVKTGKDNSAISEKSFLKAVNNGSEEFLLSQKSGIKPIKKIWDEDVNLTNGQIQQFLKDVYKKPTQRVILKPVPMAGNINILDQSWDDSKFALGGIVANQVPVEVEGQEVAETPEGQVMQFNGPSHEQGGIDTKLPVKTTIFSKRIKIDGKTMAQRKMSREKAVQRLAKALAKNPGDTAVQNALKRTYETAEMEDQRDLAVQEAAAGNSNSSQSGGQVQQFAKGSSGIKNIQNFLLEGDPNALDIFGADGVMGTETEVALDNYWRRPMDIDTEDTSITPPPALQGQGMMLDKSLVPKQPWESGYYMDVINKGITNLKTKAAEDEQAKLSDAKNDANYYKAGMPDGVTAKFNPLDTSMIYTPGDKLGTAGLGFGAAAPAMLTLGNRLGDKPNINPFEHFGVEALKSSNDAKMMLKSLKDKDANDITLQENTQRQNNRNSARSLNTIRGLDFLTGAGASKAKESASANYAKELMTLFGMDATLHNEADKMQGVGKNMQDTADRADRDNFFTQFNADMSNVSTSMQNAGKNKNEAKGRNDFLSILPELSKYGLGFVYDKNGKPVLQRVK